MCLESARPCFAGAQHLSAARRAYSRSALRVILQRAQHLVCELSFDFLHKSFCN